LAHSDLGEPCRYILACKRDCGEVPREGNIQPGCWELRYTTAVQDPKVIEGPFPFVSIARIKVIAKPSVDIESEERPFQRRIRGSFRGANSTGK